MQFLIICLLIILYFIAKSVYNSMKVRQQQKVVMEDRQKADLNEKVKTENATDFQEAMLKNFKKVERLAIDIVEHEIIDSKDHVYSSKFGGVPYFPQNLSYPRNDNGEPLALMVQFNLDELFADSEILTACQNDDLLKYLPKTGMLSFFYDVLDHDLFGLDGEVEGGYKVYYFPEVIEDETNVAYAIHDELCAIDSLDDSFTPADVKVSRSITTSLKYILPVYQNNVPISQDLDDFYNIFCVGDIYDQLFNNKEVSPIGTMIGGYPIFQQDDIRSNNDSRSVMLLQVDLYDFYHYKRSGILHYFISEEDLQTLNFSNVLANYDCD